jgi:general stress protein 26
MKRLIVASAGLFGALALAAQGTAAPAKARAQAAAQAVPPSKAQIIAAARDVMTSARYATLATIGDGGQPQARIMDPMVPDKEMTIWLGTTPLSRKVGEILKNGRVTLLYFDTKGLEYVTVLGTADVVTDKAEKAKHWKAEWSAFYKEGAKGDDFVLIRVKPSRIEVVSPRHKIMNDMKTWLPVSVNLP